VTPTPTSELARRIGEALTARRLELGMSRRALAEQAGVSNVTLLELEHGTANPTLERLERVAEHYRIDAAALLTAAGADEEVATS
jgi:transcriptional regulator with XRE-family HTH domain